MISANLTAIPESRVYTPDGWHLYWFNNEAARALEESRKKTDMEKRFQRLKNLNTMKIIFGQGDEQPEEVNG